MNHWVKVLELDAGVFGGEPPIHRRRTAVALGLPGPHGGLQGLLVADAPVGTLATEYAELGFGDIEPAAVLRSLVDLEAVPDPFGFRRLEGLVQ